MRQEEGLQLGKLSGKPIVGSTDLTLLPVLQSRLSLQNGFDEEYLPRLMDEFLLMMIRLVTEIVPPSECAPGSDNVFHEKKSSKSEKTNNDLESSADSNFGNLQNK